MKTAARKQYGHLNWNEGGTPDVFGQYEAELRGGAQRFNVGHVYDVPQVRRGGVLPGDNGIMRTRVWWSFAGVLRSVVPVQNGLASQTMLTQWGATPTRWDGDTPVTLQDLPTRAAPWRRAAPKGRVNTAPLGRVSS